MPARRRASSCHLPQRRHKRIVPSAHGFARPNALARALEADYGQRVRTRALLGIAIVVVLGAATATTANAATPENVYKNELTGTCYTAKLLVVADIKKLGRIAKNGGTPQAIGRQLAFILKRGYDLDMDLWMWPVPASLKTQMAPIRTLLKKDATVAYRVLTGKTTLEAATPTFNKNATQLAKMFDRLGVPDCGARMNKAVDKAWAEIDDQAPAK